MMKPGSNKKVWWKCINGHGWVATPNKRTGDGTNCPYCSPQTSRLEIRLFCELKYLFGNDVEWRYKIDGIEIDIFLSKYSIGIEIDGYPWHLNKDDKDIAKTAELLKRGIILFRLRDSKLPLIDQSDIFYSSLEDDLPIIRRLFHGLIQSINFDNKDVVDLKRYIDANVIRNNKEYQRILSYFPSPPPELSLASIYKHLVSEWNYEKNSPLKPENFTPSARANVWWRCLKGHEYQSYIYNRIKGIGCPYCAGVKVSNDNNLQSCFPHLAVEWHQDKNLPLTPLLVYKGSSRKVWWKCVNGHEWQATVKYRTRGKTGCPYCSSLTWRFPEVANQWHPVKNFELMPNDVTPGSHNKVWWLCENGHEWQAVIYTRTIDGTGCPYCAGRKASVDNNLKVKYPSLAAQWHHNRNYPFTPEQITPKSSKLFWWMCDNGHEWEATVESRTRASVSSCPYCAGKFLTADNNLSVKYPDLLKEWNFHKNISLDPLKLLPSSNVKAWWSCIKGHEWQTSISSRTNGKAGCPYCAIKRVSPNRNLATYFPEVAADWNYERNSGKIPAEYSPKSGEKVWWKCSRGHEWKAVIAARANGSGCPICLGRRPKSL